VNLETDLIGLAKEVATTIVSYGLPFFDAYPSAAVLLRKLRTTGKLPGFYSAQAPLVQAMLAVQEGSIDEARNLVYDAYRQAGESPFRETVALIGRRLGLIDDDTMLA
jgi:hypothetical protein